MNSWFTTEGAPYPMGVSYAAADDAYNFAIYSKNAGGVTLLLYNGASFIVPVAEIAFDFHINKSQYIWHCRVPSVHLNGAIYYAYQITGNTNITDEPAYWQQFDPEKILLDPYAREVFFPPGFDPAAACKPGSNAGKAPLGYIHAGTTPFDWQNDNVIKHEGDLIICEMHVRGFTMAAGDIDPAIRGTYAGITAKIPYLQALGITAVELMPVHQFDPSGNNYWGYSTLNFFSPHQEYAADKSPGGQINEFKTMVRALHKAGIEVIMDVVFNHTTEGDINGPTYSFKGIDNSTYYLLNDNAANPYDNFTGTGNTVRTDHPVVQKMIVDSLLYWVNEMHIGGFRFDLASIFSRTSEPTAAKPPIFAQLNTIPDFYPVRFIAEPWDAGGEYQLGQGFPGNNWSQWNGRYRDDIRSFIKSDPGLAGTAIERIYGSDDIFPDDLMNAYQPFQSINFINCHDGFTLYDVVAYNDKHNEANGQNNTDGSNNNHSWNCGWEGDINVPQQVMDLRLRQAKNLAAMLMLSNGTPMFVAGDEFLHTQFGNNNPYNQNDPNSWLDWTRLNSMQQHYDFTVQLIRFRKTYSLISRSRFWHGDFVTFGFDGNAVNYSDPSLFYFAYHLTDSSGSGQELYVMINVYWNPQNFTIAIPGPWKQLINTYLGAGQDITLDDPAMINGVGYLVGERSVVVLGK